MAQKNTLPLMQALCEMGYETSLETNGYYSTKDVDPRVVKVIDIKTPGSDEGDSFDFDNVKHLKEKDQVKFVICDDQDYLWAKNLVQKHQLNERCTVFFSPAFDSVSNQDLAEKILADSLPVRLQLQLHKYIWNPQERGV